MIDLKQYCKRADACESVILLGWLLRCCKCKLNYMQEGYGLNPASTEMSGSFQLTLKGTESSSRLIAIIYIITARKSLMSKSARPSYLFSHYFSSLLKKN